MNVEADKMPLVHPPGGLLAMCATDLPSGHEIRNEMIPYSLNRVTDFLQQALNSRVSIAKESFELPLFRFRKDPTKIWQREHI